MNHKSLLTVLVCAFAWLAPSPSARSQEIPYFCGEFVVSGEWYFDFDTSGYALGTLIQQNFDIGGQISATINGTGYTFGASTPINISFTVQDLGTNPSNLFDPVTGLPDGLPDPVWIMNTFSVSAPIHELVTSMDSFSIGSSWQYSTFTGPGSLQITNFSATIVDPHWCPVTVPEPSGALLIASLGGFVMLRRKRHAR